MKQIGTLKIEKNILKTFQNAELKVLSFFFTPPPDDKSPVSFSLNL